MRKLVFVFLLPLVLFQTPVLAQSESLPETNKPQPLPPETTQATKPKEEPTLLPLKGTEQINLQLVNCNSVLDCGIAQLLLPRSAYINQRELRFDNSTKTPVSILNIATVLDGELTGYQLTNKAISVSQDIKSLPANQIVSIPITINRLELPPDRYSGSIYLTLQDRNTRLSLPVTISVRSGPLLPIVVLFFGVILGRLLKYMQEKGEPQAKALQEVYRLQADIKTAKLDDSEKQLLANMAAEVQTLVARQQLETTSTQIQAIRDRLNILVKLEALEEELNQQATSFPTDVDEFTLKIGKVRRFVSQREDDKAKELLQQITSDLDSVSPRGGENAGVEASKRSLQNIVIAMSQTTKSLAPTASNWIEKLSEFMIHLSGVSERATAEATFWVVRPILSLTLLVGISAVGVGSLYVENGATFGARPFTDYFGLILWGLSADVASRSLSNLKGSKDS